MTAFPSYSTGTVSVANGDKTIVGVGTIWSAVNARAGDDIVIAGHTVIVEDVTDTNHLVIDAWPYADVPAGSGYKIVQRSPLRGAFAQMSDDMIALVKAFNTDGFYIFVPPNLAAPDPSYGNEDQFAFQASTKRLWLKTGGAWVFQGVYKGFNIRGAYNNAATYALGDVVSSGGSSYVWSNAVDGSGQAPPDTTYWQLLAAKGADGVDGDTGPVGPQGASYGGTSTTSLAIGTGAKAFTTQTGLAYQNGARVRASATADTTKWMEGLATYSGTALTITVDKVNGSGTFASWNLNVVGQPGAGDLSSANNLSDVANIETARSNLGALAAGITKAVQQAATDNTIGVTPAHQQDHPSAAKAWVKFSGVGGVTVLASYNIGTIVRAGLGSYSIPFLTPFATANYVISYAVLFTTGGHAQFMRVSSMTPSGVAVLTLDATFNPADTDGLMLVFFGTQ
jgi:hypothetical protein